MVIVSLIIIGFTVNTKQDIPSMPSEWQGRSHTNSDPKIIPSSQALHCIRLLNRPYCQFEKFNSRFPTPFFSRLVVDILRWKVNARV